MSDRDMLEAQGGTIPMQASEAIKVPGESQVDTDILGLFDEVYGSVRNRRVGSLRHELR